MAAHLLVLHHLFSALGFPTYLGAPVRSLRHHNRAEHRSRNLLRTQHGSAYLPAPHHPCPHLSFSLSLFLSVFHSAPPWFLYFASSLPELDCKMQQYPERKPLPTQAWNAWDATFSMEKKKKKGRCGIFSFRRSDERIIIHGT